MKSIMSNKSGTFNCLFSVYFQPIYSFLALQQYQGLYIHTYTHVYTFIYVHIYVCVMYIYVYFVICFYALTSHSYKSHFESNLSKMCMVNFLQCNNSFCPHTWICKYNIERSYVYKYCHIHCILHSVENNSQFPLLLYHSFSRFSL